MWLYPNIVAWQECRRLHVPYAYVPHGMLDQYSIFGAGALKAVKKMLYLRLIESRIIAGATRLWVASAREQRHAERIWPPAAQRCTIMPCAVSVSHVRPRDPQNSMLRIPRGTKIALFFGRVHPKKNVHFLLECWRAARIPRDYQLWIVGPCAPQYQRKLEKLLASGTADNVRLHLSFVSGQDKRYLLNAADWFVLPSLQENFGIAVLEAAAIGTPVAISPEVYLGDEFPQGAEIIGLNKSDWVRFFEERMANSRWRQFRAETDKIALEHLLSVDHIVPQWVSATRNLAAVGRTGEFKAPAYHT
jgi:glycosyltransferase involved in cell wall biosynthesis